MLDSQPIPKVKPSSSSEQAQALPELKTEIDCETLVAYLSKLSTQQLNTQFTSMLAPGLYIYIYIYIYICIYICT